MGTGGLLCWVFRFNNLVSNVLKLEWMVGTRGEQRKDYSSLYNGPCCILPRMHQESLFCVQLRCAPCEACSSTCSSSLLCTPCHSSIRFTGGINILRHTIVRGGRLCGPLLLEVTYVLMYVFFFSTNSHFLYPPDSEFMMPRKNTYEVTHTKATCKIK